MNKLQTELQSNKCKDIDNEILQYQQLLEETENLQLLLDSKLPEQKQIEDKEENLESSSQKSLLFEELIQQKTEKTEKIQESNEQIDIKAEERLQLSHIVKPGNVNWQNNEDRCQIIKQPTLEQKLLTTSQLLEKSTHRDLFTLLDMQKNNKDLQPSQIVNNKKNHQITQQDQELINRNLNLINSMTEKQPVQQQKVQINQKQKAQQSIEKQFLDFNCENQQFLNNTTEQNIIIQLSNQSKELYKYSVEFVDLKENSIVKMSLSDNKIFPKCKQTIKLTKSNAQFVQTQQFYIKISDIQNNQYFKIPINIQQPDLKITAQLVYDQIKQSDQQKVNTITCNCVVDKNESIKIIINNLENKNLQCQLKIINVDEKDIQKELEKQKDLKTKLTFMQILNNQNIFINQQDKYINFSNKSLVEQNNLILFPLTKGENQLIINYNPSIQNQMKIKQFQFDIIIEQKVKYMYQINLQEINCPIIYNDTINFGYCNQQQNYTLEHQIELVNDISKTQIIKLQIPEQLKQLVNLSTQQLLFNKICKKNTFTVSIQIPQLQECLQKNQIQDSKQYFSILKNDNNDINNQLLKVQKSLFEAQQQKNKPAKQTSKNQQNNAKDIQKQQQNEADLIQELNKLLIGSYIVLQFPIDIFISQTNLNYKINVKAIICDYKFNFVNETDQNENIIMYNQIYEYTNTIINYAPFQQKFIIKVTSNLKALTPYQILILNPGEKRQIKQQILGDVSSSQIVKFSCFNIFNECQTFQKTLIIKEQLFKFNKIQNLNKVKNVIQFQLNIQQKTNQTCQVLTQIYNNILEINNPVIYNAKDKIINIQFKADINKINNNQYITYDKITQKINFHLVIVSSDNNYQEQKIIISLDKL